MRVPTSKYEKSLLRNRIADAEMMAVKLMVDLIVNGAKQCDGLDLKLTPEEAARASHVVRRLDTEAECAMQLLSRDE